MHYQKRWNLTRVVFAISFLALLAVSSFGRMTPKAPQDILLTTPAALIVEVDARGNISLNDVKYGTVANASRLTTRLNEIFAARTRNLVYADRDGATMTQIPLGERIAKRLYVQPDPAFPLSSLLKFLSAVTATDTNYLSVNLRRGDLSHEVVIERPGKIASNQASPSYLLIQMDYDRVLSLNDKAIASIDALREQLTATFDTRRQKREFAPGTSSIDQSVWLQFDQALGLADVLDILVGISPTYARPVFLRLDPVQRIYRDVPPKPKPKPKPTGRRARRA